VAASTAILVPAQPASAASFVTISGAGSTWSYNAINDWIANVAVQGMPLNYTPIGSVSGLQDFATGVVDWAASDFPYGVDGTINNPPPATRGFTYMPDTAGGVALMYNLTIGGTQVTNLRLSGATIAGIFTGVITNWDAPQIAADNPGLNLPSLPIVPVVRTDASGATSAFTTWMLATESSDWTAYCAKVGLSPCTQTAAYPVLPNSAMIGQAGDLGVSGYVKQPKADGAIGYVEYSYAQQSGFPVAKVLNAAGYYTAPTPDNIGVSLLSAQVNTDNTENLSQVYTDSDPRTYELSYYSCMIVPTDLTAPMTTAKGDTLSAFDQYLLCQGQQQVDSLGYAALPVSLVQDGFTQLLKIPGNQVGTVIAAQGAGAAAGSIALGVTVPEAGDFTVTVPAGTVDLRYFGNSGVAAGQLQRITVSDTRNAMPSPGWSATGQASDFTGRSGARPRIILGTALGWVPTGTVARGAALGPAVLPGSPGLGSAGAVLAEAPSGSGSGTSTVSATLSLRIPASAALAPYTGLLTITYLIVAPLPASSGQKLLPRAR
jgi:phosphate ABC transporter phosphate-binding protein